jgi:hypothetical protein
VEIFSVITSPGGKVLIEVASRDPGRGTSHFHAMPHARAVLGAGLDNIPASTEERLTRPLAPLRISRAVGHDLLEATLAFYGPTSTALGFGHSRILLDETNSNGDRAVTLQLSPNATVHLQLWARASEPVGDGPSFPIDGDFVEAVESNQVSGGQPTSAAEFCNSGEWTVDRYNTYVLKTHETVMTFFNASNDSDAYLHPPAGASFDVFIDDHLSWDCTSPLECDKAAGGAALYALGSRVQWLGSPEAGWTAYSYDPTGYGIELHWFAAPDDFEPSGLVQPSCFVAYAANGTCPGAIAQVLGK